MPLVFLAAACSGTIGDTDPDGGIDGSDGFDPSDASDAGADPGRDPGPDGSDPGADPGADPVPDGGDPGADQGPLYGAEFYVAPGGNDDHSGTIDFPFATLERARTAVRELKAGTGLPENGVVVWLRGGRHVRTSTFELTAEDSGEEERPVAFRGYPGEQARVTGASLLEPEWFSLVTDASPVWDRVDPSARGQLVQVDLAAHGIDDYGALVPRGFGGSGNAALELFFDGQPMWLGRWPDRDDSDPPVSHHDDQIVLYGDPSPDVTGLYLKTGTQDGVNAFTRDGLVGGLQYHLYRYNWEYQNNWHTAWFLTTGTSGYPGNDNPWWHQYSHDLSVMNPANGATGTPTIYDPAGVNHGFVRIAEALDDTSFTYSGTRPERWTAAPAIWFHGYWVHMWADRHVAAASIDTGTRTITLAEVPGYGIETAQPYYAYNLLEEITEPGEWYLERGTGVLYFWPPGELANAETEVSMLDAELIRLNGTSHVILEDLVFESTRRRLVVIESGSDNLVSRCTLRNAGTDAASVKGVRNGLDHCEIFESGDRCVSVSGGDRASLTPAGNFVTHCHMHHFGRWSWTYKPAVSVGGVGQRIAHNHMHSAPHSAMLYSGNEHLIEYNDIHHVCEYSSDAGAIYAGRDWGWRGNLIRYNFIHHIDTWFEGYGVHGVYLDDCLSGIEVFANLFVEVSGHAIQHGGGRDNIMHNNLVVRCGDALSADSRGLTAINNTPGDSWNLLERLHRDGVEYQQEPWASAYPRLAVIPDDWAQVSDPGALWLYPEGCVFSRNFGFANTQWIRENVGSGTGTLNKYDEIADNVEDQDPQFVDEQNGNYNLEPGSPVFDVPGFVPIPFDQIGIQ